VLCHHPTAGLIWVITPSAGELPLLGAHLPMWRSLTSDNVLDTAIGPTQHMINLHLLLHEMLIGRYSFERFLDDLRARAKFTSVAI
jgi:hypothetical protein